MFQTRPPSSETLFLVPAQRQRLRDQSVKLRPHTRPLTPVKEVTEPDSLVENKNWGGGGAGEAGMEGGRQKSLKIFFTVK